jgi:hypothetical protein
MGMIDQTTSRIKITRIAICGREKALIEGLIEQSAHRSMQAATTIQIIKKMKLNI